MKRFLSLILAITVLASMFSVGVSVFAQKTRSTQNKSFGFCVNSDGRFTKGRGNRPDKFNVPSDGLWNKEFNVRSDGKPFNMGKHRGNRPDKFKVPSDGLWNKEFKPTSDGDNLSHRKARDNKFPVKKQSTNQNMFFPWDKNNMNFFGKNKNFKPLKK